ncbi:cell wall-binding repeat-containing protein [Salana multivorans]
MTRTFQPVRALARPLGASVATLALVLAATTAHGVSDGSLGGGSTVVPTRLSGGDRYETAAEIAKTFTGSSTVYVASGADYPDALSGGPAAIVDRAPVLLVGSSIDEKTAAQLSRLKPKEIVIVGGEGSVSASVAAALGSYSEAITRLSGRDRYETSAIVSADTFKAGTAVAFVASGEDYADALSGTPAAGSASAPILLTRKGELPEPVRAELRSTRATQRHRARRGRQRVGRGGRGCRSRCGRHQTHPTLG